MTKIIANPVAEEELQILSTASDFYADFLKLDQTTPQSIQTNLNTYLQIKNVTYFGVNFPMLSGRPDDGSYAFVQEGGLNLISATDGTLPSIYFINAANANFASIEEFSLNGDLKYTAAGHYFTGKIGLGTTAPTNTLSFGNTSIHKIWIENSATDVVGRALTISAGSTVTGTSVNNVTGGLLILASGTGTGTGASNILFQTGTTGTTGKVAQTLTTKMTLSGRGRLTIGNTSAYSYANLNLISVTPTTLPALALVYSDGIAGVEIRTSFYGEDGNMFFGKSSGMSNVGLGSCTFFGYESGKSATAGNSLCAFGYGSMANATTALSCNAMGSASLNSLTTGYDNNAMGDTSLSFLVDGNKNCAMGSKALLYLISGNDNTAVGYFTLINATSNNNTAIGSNAGRTLIDGYNNTFIGYISGYNGLQKTDAVNSMALGYGTYTTASNQVIIGNASVNVGLAQTAPTARLHLPAGTATANTAPLKLISGVLMTNPEAGAIEFLSDKFYATQTTGTTRKEIKLVDQYYAEMYEYENANLTTIGTQDVYHAVNHFITGLLSGFTFVSGIDGTIASVANYNATVAGTILITDVAHGLATGDIITIHSTTNYNGTYSITKVTNDTFYVTKAYVATETGDWAMGSYLRCSTGSDGVYKISMNLTAFAASNNTLFKFELNKNTTPLDNIAVSNKFATIDYTPLSSSGLVSVVAGDRIWLSVKNQTSSTNITVRHANINLTRN